MLLIIDKSKGTLGSEFFNIGAKFNPFSLSIIFFALAYLFLVQWSKNLEKNHFRKNVFWENPPSQQWKCVDLNELKFMCNIMKWNCNNSYGYGRASQSKCRMEYCCLDFIVCGFVYARMHATRYCILLYVHIRNILYNLNTNTHTLALNYNEKKETHTHTYYKCEHRTSNRQWLAWQHTAGTNIIARNGILFCQA